MNPYPPDEDLEVTLDPHEEFDTEVEVEEVELVSEGVLGFTMQDYDPHPIKTAIAENFGAVLFTIGFVVYVVVFGLTA